MPTVSGLKAKGDAAFEDENFRDAIKFYASALELGEGHSVEEQRELLAKRSEAYLLYGDIYSAMRDANETLSPAYTTASSPVALTIACYYRRATLNLKMVNFQGATEDYEAFQRHANQQDPPYTITEKEKELLTEIQKATKAPKGGHKQFRFKLLRAIQERGIILEDKYRSSFPTHPSWAREEATDFADGLDWQTANIRDPLSIAFSIGTPCLGDIFRPSHIAGPLVPMRLVVKMEETETIGSHLEGLFEACMLSAQVPIERLKLWIPNALVHQDPQKSTVVLITHRGRFLVIPHSTLVKDIWAGARWPREGPLAFQDLRKQPRARVYEPDGASFGDGFSVGLAIFPNDQLTERLQMLERGLEQWGL